MLDAVGAERVEGADHRLRSGQLAGVGNAEKSAVLGEGEGLGERLGGKPALVVGQSQTDDPLVPIAHGQAGLGDGVGGIHRPIAGDHHGGADPEAPPRLGQGVEGDLDDRLDRAQAFGVAGAYMAGSIQRLPSTAASSTTSLTTRRRSAGRRITSQAATYMPAKAAKLPKPRIAGTSIP